MDPNVYGLYNPVASRHDDQQCLFHLAHCYFTFPVTLPYLYTTLNIFRSASWVFFSLPVQTWVKRQYFFSINIQYPLSQTNRVEGIVQHDTQQL